MAVATSIMTGIGLLGSTFQIIKGAQDKSDSEKTLENYDRQDFTNIADTMQVSTLGSDLKREESGRLGATKVDTLAGGGSRLVLGGLGYVDKEFKDENRQIAAELDAEQNKISQMRAQDQANIRAMQEQREQQDIAALSSQYNAGNQMMFQGIGSVAQTSIAALGALSKNKKNKYDPETGELLTV